MKKSTALLLLVLGLTSTNLKADPIWKLGTSDETLPPLALRKSEVVPVEGRGLGLAFSGYGSRAQINDIIDFTGGGETTISLFFRCDEFPLERADGSLGASCLLSINYDVLLRVYSSGVVYAGYRNEADGLIGVFSTQTNKVTIGQWHHLAATFSSKDQILKVYLDGAMVGKSLGPTGNLGPLRSSTLVIGSDPDESSFIGEIADVRIFDTALEPDAIQQLQEMTQE